MWDPRSGPNLPLHTPSLPPTSTMQNLPEEVLLPPKPYVALLGDLEYVEILAVSLKTAGGPRPGGPSSMYMRYEPYPLTKRFMPRQRSHGEHEYPSYIPAGILRSNWMKKHQDEVPAVIVRDCAHFYASGAFFSPCLFSLYPPAVLPPMLTLLFLFISPTPTLPCRCCCSLFPRIRK